MLCLVVLLFTLIHAKLQCDDMEGLQSFTCKSKKVLRDVVNYMLVDEEDGEKSLFQEPLSVIIEKRDAAALNKILKQCEEKLIQYAWGTCNIHREHFDYYNDAIVDKLKALNVFDIDFVDYDYDPTKSYMQLRLKKEDKPVYKAHQ